MKTIILFTLSLLCFAQSQEQCVQMDGRMWVDGRGCLEIANTSDIKAGFEACEGLEGEPQNICLKKAADEQTARLSDQYKDDSLLDANKNKASPAAYSPHALAIMASTYFLIKNKGKGCSPSYWISFTSGVAAIATEFVTSTGYRKRLRQIANEYKENSSGDLKTQKDSNDTMTKQMLAFDSLIEQEKAIENWERLRGIGYSLAAAGYTGAALLTALEITGTVGAGIDPSCSCIIRKNNKLELMLRDSFLMLNAAWKMTINQFFAYAGTGLEPVIKFIEGVDAIKTNASAKAQARIIKKSLFVRFASQTFLAVQAGLQAKQSFKTVKIAKKRQAEIEKIKTAFLNTGGTDLNRCSPQMRGNPQLPSCFCYTIDNKKDERKSRFPQCVQQWGTLFDASLSDYSSSSGDAAKDMSKTCIDANYGVDRFCKCRLTNSCLKFAPSTLNMGANGNWIGQLLEQNNSLFSNGIESAALKADSYDKQAFTLKKKLDELTASKEFQKYTPQIEKITASLKKNQAQLVASNAPTSLPTTPTTSKPVQKIIKKSNTTNINKTSTLPSSVSQRSGKKAKANFDLDFGESGGVKVSNSVGANDFGENFAIKNDIVKKPEASIFRILSNRYKSSGMRDLFEE